MTSLVAWTGVDTHGPSSVYLATDSRITWSADGRVTGVWDLARKLFASQRSSDILAYAGDVLFPTQVLGQLISLLDAGMLFAADATPEIRVQSIASVLRECMSRYPGDQLAGGGKVVIVHCCRSGERMASAFHVTELIYDATTRGWIVNPLPLPTESDIVCVHGTGARFVTTWKQRWDSALGRARTSRGVFSAFCRVLLNQEDSRTGGAPQLVGIYRLGPARTFGAIYGGQRYLFGLPAPIVLDDSQIEWRDDLFQRCDPVTLARLEDAQRHHRPRGL
jgi:hypothetical protein